ATFFSSRRRHTRWPRDWSSDVCSSDLVRRVPVTMFAQGRTTTGSGRGGRSDAALVAGRRRVPARTGTRQSAVGTRDRFPLVLGRSEERRVGKSGGVGWGGSLKKKNRAE